MRQMKVWIYRPDMANRVDPACLYDHRGGDYFVKGYTESKVVNFLQTRFVFLYIININQILIYFIWRIRNAWVECSNHLVGTSFKP